MTFKIRRIVTAHDTKGRSTIASDGYIVSKPSHMNLNVSVANVWINETTPPILDGPDPTLSPVPTLPRDGGAVFRMLELAPGTEPRMHMTDTIDFVVVTEGELSMLLEDGTELRMKPQDLMVQRATVHGWANRTDKPCRFATVVIDAAKKL